MDTKEEQQRGWTVTVSALKNCLVTWRRWLQQWRKQTGVLPVWCWRRCPWRSCRSWRSPPPGVSPGNAEGSHCDWSSQPCLSNPASAITISIIIITVVIIITTIVITVIIITVIIITIITQDNTAMGYKMSTTPATSSPWPRQTLLTLTADKHCRQTNAVNRHWQQTNTASRQTPTEDRHCWQTLSADRHC